MDRENYGTVVVFHSALIAYLLYLSASLINRSRCHYWFNLVSDRFPPRLSEKSLFIKFSKSSVVYRAAVSRSVHGARAGRLRANFRPTDVSCGPVTEAYDRKQFLFATHNQSQPACTSHDFVGSTAHLVINIGGRTRSAGAHLVLAKFYIRKAMGSLTS